MTDKYRIEKDSIGEMRVPADAYYGSQTARALENFPIGEERFPRPFLRALARVKLACATANEKLGALDARLAAPVKSAATEVVDGRLDDDFPLVVWQAGSGTQVNMNANEVIANRANELLGKPRGTKTPVHPNDHVNMGQSSNDVIPTAMYVATAAEITAVLLPSLDLLRDGLDQLAVRYRGLVKLGRTHLMDAVPLTLGQEMSGHAARLEAAQDRLAAAVEGLLEIPLGGTAVGTGLNAKPGFAEAAIEELARLTGLPLRPARNRFAAQGAHDAMVAASASLRGTALTLYKIADDIRLLGSGPRAGLAELRLPANEPGSSIMPGKVNPTQCEALIMVCAQVVGNDTAVAMGGASGHLQMSASKPLMILNALRSVDLLASASSSFARRCIDGLEPNESVIRSNVERSLMLGTALAPEIGYDRAAEVSQYALERDLSLKQAAVDLGYVTAEQFDRLVQPERMAGSHGISDSETGRD